MIHKVLNYFGGVTFLKTILIFAGLKYTVEEDTFIFAENLPQEWDSMEYNIPVPDQNGHIVWVIAKVERYQMTKTVVNGTDCQIKNKIITVENNPFR